MTAVYNHSQREKSTHQIEIKSLKDSNKMYVQKSYRCVIMIIIAVFLYVELGGCAAAYVSKYHIAELPDRSGNILSDRMDYAGVHDTLGNPLISSQYWRVEVFRDSSSQIEIPIAITPWPIPFARLKDDIYRYTLVSYDKDQIAEHTETGILRKPSKWRTASPIEYNDQTLQMEAGDFTFISHWSDRSETLLVNPNRRDDFLDRALFSSQCTAVIGCGTGGCSSELSVDGGASLPVPCPTLKLYLNINPVAALSLSPGTHTFKASSTNISGEQSITFSCQEGEVLYFVIDISVTRYRWLFRDDTEWKIDMYKEIPEIFTNSDLILYRGEQWIENPEPGNKTD